MTCRHCRAGRLSGGAEGTGGCHPRPWQRCPLIALAGVVPSVPHKRAPARGAEDIGWISVSAANTGWQALPPRGSRNSPGPARFAWAAAPARPALGTAPCRASARSAHPVRAQGAAGTSAGPSSALACTHHRLLKLSSVHMQMAD